MQLYKSGPLIYAMRLYKSGPLIVPVCITFLFNAYYKLGPGITWPKRHCSLGLGHPFCAQEALLLRPGHPCHIGTHVQAWAPCKRHDHHASCLTLGATPGVELDLLDIPY